MKEHFKIEDGHILIGGVNTVKLTEKVERIEEGVRRIEELEMR